MRTDRVERGGTPFRIGGVACDELHPCAARRELRVERPAVVVVLPRADIHAATGQRQRSAHVSAEAAAPAEHERRPAGQRLCRRL